jgi:hypothetical protein
MGTTRRQFIELASASVGAAALSGCGQQPVGDPQSSERLAAELLRLNEAAAIGVTPDDFELARKYVVGAYQEVRLKLRPIVLRDDLDLPIHFTAKTTA